MLERLVKVCKDALFPRRCNGCAKLFRASAQTSSFAPFGALEAVFAAGAGECFCDKCAQANWVATPMCARCGLPFTSSQGVDHLCMRCLDQPFGFDEARAAGKYQDCLRSLVQDFKYRGHAHLSGPLGRLLWAALMTYWHPDDFDKIVPVPLHWRRLIHRGFNQADLLLSCWPRAAKEAGLVFDPQKIAARLMIRHRPTTSQTGLGRPQREANLRKAFKLRDPDTVCDQRFLIVDDVFTTGATADACSRVLKRAGAASVKVLTLTRAV